MVASESESCFTEARMVQYFMYLDIVVEKCMNKLSIPLIA